MEIGKRKCEIDKSKNRYRIDDIFWEMDASEKNKKLIKMTGKT